MIKKATLLALLAAGMAAAGAQTLSFQPLGQDVVVGRVQQLKDNNQAREQELKAMFQSAGCTGEHLKEQAVAGAPPNVVCVLPGESDSTILVGAHTDHVEQGMGAIDNWTGASLLPDLYETLSKKKPRHTFVFIGFTNEERGLVGSRAYVKAMTPEEKARTFAMVNLDSLGRGTVEAWGNVVAPGLKSLYAQIATTLKVTPVVAIIGRSDADSDSFSQAGIAAITLDALPTASDLALLHTANDQLAKIDEAAYYGNYRFVSYYLLLLDSKSSLAVSPAAPKKKK